MVDKRHSKQYETIDWENTLIRVERDGEELYYGSVLDVEVDSVAVEWFDSTSLVLYGPDPEPEHEDVRLQNIPGTNRGDRYVIAAEETLDVSMEVNVDGD